MINTDQLHELSLIGGTVTGNDGEKIGKLGQVFLDEQTGEPEWVTVNTGFFGLSENFVPWPMPALPETP
ncbi:PRC-barrel domain-containing protein [Glutamicibacter sp. BW77]|uniref:PRC-barrel domain-containing protein n=1 Tax=Glutamicibacter sp. BW77 TaxID=2024402 RepID=UPI0026918F02